MPRLVEDPRDTGRRPAPGPSEPVRTLRHATAAAARFVHWTELIANHVAHGSSAESVRGYLKDLAKATS